MAKKITVTFVDGSVREFRSTIFTGYHLKEAGNGVCVTEKPLFGKEHTVACFLAPEIQQADVVRCPVCEAVNPTQRTT